jgi:hypothetical protein
MLWYLFPGVVLAILGAWMLYEVAWDRGWRVGFYEDWTRRSQHENELFEAWLKEHGFDQH